MEARAGRVSGLLQVVGDSAAVLNDAMNAPLNDVKAHLGRLDANLRHTSYTVDAVLRDGASRELPHPVREWRTSLKAVACAVEDLLSEFRRRRAPLPDGDGNGYGGVSRFGCRSSCPICVGVLSCATAGPEPDPFRLQLAHDVKAIAEEVRWLVKSRDKILGLSQGEVTISSVPDAASSAPPSLPSTDMVGRERQKEEIVSMLLTTLDDGGSKISSSRLRSLLKVPVISIVGMVGIGKTTLARAVYDDIRVQEHFCKRKWIDVGEHFDEMKIMLQIIENPRPDSLETHQMYPMQKIKGPTFLIVLDDVQNVSDNLLDYLKRGGEGGKIVVTTRSQRVVRELPPGFSCHLMRLSDEECLQIFERFAFPDAGSEKDPCLKEMASSIVKKLKGVPLAVEIVGRALGQQLDKSHWKGVLRDGIWSMKEVENSILPALKLSYNCLPEHLKQCFVYCSLFPKGHKYDRGTLVQMWMALDFVQTQGRRREDVGNDYFDHLSEQFFFQQIDGSYFMHDMFHHLAETISRGECLRMEDQGPEEIHGTVRHLSFSYNGLKNLRSQGLLIFKTVQTLLYSHELSSVRLYTIPPYVFTQFLNIRVLDLSNSEIRSLPDSIKNLEFLRYLNLSFTNIRKLPESLCSLCSLQTLKVEEHEWQKLLDELPRGIICLVNLRHLQVPDDLIAEIASIGRLSALQELKVFNVRKEDGYKIGELSSMTELGGELLIQNLDNVESGEEAASIQLKGKERLVELKLEWDEHWDAFLRSHTLDEEILEGLAPPPRLARLEIGHNCGLRFPRWMSEQMPSTLVSVCLYGCQNWEALPPLGRLPHLQSLSIKKMDAVKQVGQEFYGLAVKQEGQEFYGHGNGKKFPKLSELVFEDMANWEEWLGVEEEGQVFPSLNMLEIMRCPKLRKLPKLPPTLTKLSVWNLGLSDLPELWRCKDTATPVSFTCLVICGCQNIKSLPTGLLCHLKKLDTLEIRRCSELTSLKLQSLTFLKHLKIEECLKLDPQFSSSVSSSLEHLDTDCGQLILWFIPKGLSSLRRLVIHNCPELISFTEEEEKGWENLVHLEQLCLWDCGNLRALPAGLERLPSLLEIDIRGCPEIRSLPENGLPISVQHMWIGGCPKLRDRLREGGLERHKVAAIPCIHII